MKGNFIQYWGVNFLKGFILITIFNYLFPNYRINEVFFLFISFVVSCFNYYILEKKAFTSQLTSIKKK